jgi:hypothetical protein
MKRANAGLQLGRAIEIQAEGKKIIGDAYLLRRQLRGIVGLRIKL